jgi:hypothetical protein
MIAANSLQVGDTILYKRRKKIMEWEVNTIAPTGKYAEIENDDWSARWVYYGDILEILESDESNASNIDISATVEHHPVIESKFK